MFPTSEGESLAAACAHKLNAGAAASTEANAQGAAASSGSKTSSSSQHQGPRQRRGSPGSSRPRGAAPADPRLSRSRSAAAASTAAAPAHTPEQARLCEVVLKEKCYYSTLGVPKDASEEIIRKAYRRVSSLTLLFSSYVKAQMKSSCYQRSRVCVSHTAGAAAAPGQEQSPQSRRCFQEGKTWILTRGSARTCVFL